MLFADTFNSIVGTVSMETARTLQQQSKDACCHGEDATKRYHGDRIEQTLDEEWGILFSHTGGLMENSVCVIELDAAHVELILWVHKLPQDL